MAHRPSIISENARLQGRVADLEGQNERLARYRRDNEELRRLLNMPKQTAGKLVADPVLEFVDDEVDQFVPLSRGQRVGHRCVVLGGHRVRPI